MLSWPQKARGSHCWGLATNQVRVVGKGWTPYMSQGHQSVVPQQQFPMSTQDIADTALEKLHAPLLEYFGEL